MRVSLDLHPITTATEIESHAQHVVRQALATSTSTSTSTATSIPASRLITGLAQLTARHDAMLKQHMEEMDLQQVCDSACEMKCVSGMHMFACVLCRDAHASSVDRAFSRVHV